MHRKVGYQTLVVLLGSVAGVAAAGDLYRYVNDQGITVLDGSVPPHYVSRGYEVLDVDGRVKLVVPAALTREEREAVRTAELEQQHRATADGTLLRLYSSVKDLDRAHDRQIQQIENLIATAEAGLLILQAQRDDLQSRAAAQERAGRKVESQIRLELDEVEAEQGRLQRQITSNRTEIDSVNEAFASRRQRLQQLLGD